MSTLSIPMTTGLEEVVNRLVKEGHGANKADVVRKAIKKFAEDQAVEAVLRAERETPLRGDIRDLMRKLA
jgi:Arc/MetJ-type ribon-helix-helix transcriptional regulator